MTESLGLAPAVVRDTLARLASQRRVVEGDFRVVRTPGDENLPPQDQWLVQHRNYRVLMRPRSE